MLTNLLLLLDHFEKSCQKLSYLPVGDDISFPSEILRDIPHKANQQEDLISNVGDVFTFSVMEQLPKLENQSLCQKFKFYAIKCMNMPSDAYRKSWKIMNNYFAIFQEIPANQFVTCVVPLPHFNTYYRTSVREAHLNFLNSKSKTVDLAQLLYKKESLFMQLSLNQFREPNIWKQGDGMLAILLQYKWRTFIRTRFLLICAIHLVYYISYSTGVQFALEMYSYDSTSKDRSIIANGWHLTSIILFFCSGFLLFLQECTQMPRSRLFIYYFASGYNYIDLAAIFIPFFTFLQLVLNWDYFVNNLFIDSKQMCMWI